MCFFSRTHLGLALNFSAPPVLGCQLLMSQPVDLWVLYYVEGMLSFPRHTKHTHLHGGSLVVHLLGPAHRCQVSGLLHAQAESIPSSHVG